MKDRNKKIRVPVLMQTAILFLLALILSTAGAMVLKHNYILNDAAEQGGDIARVVATSAEIAVVSEGNMHALMNDEQLREDVHKRFRYICSKVDIKYLYLYTIDSNGYRHNIICAADDEEEDRKLNEECGFGYVNKRPLYDAEKEVLNGNLDGTHEFINDDYFYGDVCMFVLPVIRQGEIRALIGVDYSIDEIIEIEHENMKFLLIQVVITMVIAYVISLLLIRRSVIRPILALSERMRNFVRNRKAQIKADVKEPLFLNEITDIEDSFDKMAGDISGYVEDIKELAEEKAQSNVQLDIARKIHMGLIPQEHSQFGEGYEAFGCEHPAREVGGDFYDIFSPSDDHICVIVGDISGKGISAALFMIMVRTAIIEKIGSGCPLDETLNSVNNDICLSNPEGMFATVFVLLLNTKTGLVRFANAGHEAPYLLKKEASYLDMDPGTALGLFEDPKIIMEEFKLESGEGILIYTDGVTETINKDSVQYGREGLEKTVKDVYEADNGTYCAEKIVQALVRSVKEFSEGLVQFDDITCAALVFNENQGKGISSDIGSFAKVKHEIISSLGESEETKRMLLVCEEMYSNIINYSGADFLSFSCERMGPVYSVTFTDNGIPFDPVSVKIKEKEFEDLDTGGMGIKLARMYSSDMVYLRMEDKNILTLKFDIVQE